MFSFFTYIEYMVLATGGTLVPIILAFLLNLADGTLSGLLLLGVRDGVVRTRLNVWLVWNGLYTVALLLLVIIGLSVVPIVVGVGVMTGLQTLLAIGFRLVCMWTGWKYRESLMAAPPPASQHRPDLGTF